MAQLHVIDIPYQADGSALFESVRDLASPVWLDSGRPASLYGRYDIISAAPSQLLTTRGDTTHITGQQRNWQSQDNPFDLVAQSLQPIGEHAAKDIPFCGGALGYFGYGLGERLLRLPNTRPSDINLPDMSVGIYDWAIVQDHQQQHSWVIFLPQCPASVRRDIQQRCRNTAKEAGKSFEIESLKNDISKESYTQSIDKIHAYIAAGDCYQVNFAQRFSADYLGDSYAIYQALREVLPSPFSAYMELEEAALLSLSPERFLHVSGRQAETNPIKGTLPRSSDPLQDNQLAQELLNSAKDRAENLMIVDLLRNDLSKNCTLGSVRVPELFNLKSFPNVHHLVSTITGTLEADKSPFDLLKGCFPGGSITGAPKKRAMEVIEELEASKRSAYCGSVGYISANGNMDTNIAIRTLVCAEQKIHCWGGGGIVADSCADKEYEESLSKVQVLLDTLAKYQSD